MKNHFNSNVIKLQKKMIELKIFKNNNYYYKKNTHSKFVFVLIILLLTSRIFIQMFEINCSCYCLLYFIFIQSIFNMLWLI